MMRQIAKKLSLSKLVILAIFFLGAFLVVLFSSHILNPTITKKVTSSTYTNNVNYQVYLLNNNFISQPSLGMDEAYIASMVNYVTVNFRQSSSFRNRSTFRYNYNIYARLSATYQTEDGNDSEIWSQTFPLKTQDIQSATEENFSIQEQVSVPYWDYQSIVDSFKNTYHLKMDVSLDVIMDIEYRFNDATTKTSTMKLSIPMNQDVFQIATDYEKEEQVSNTEEFSNMTMPIAVAIVLLVLFGGAGVVACFFLFIKLLQLYSNTEYERIKNKIRKDYGSIIVDVDNAIDFSKFTIFEIKTIAELVDLEEELRIPILFYEKKKAGICYFVIIKDHYMYRFTLRDLEQEII